MDKEIDETLQKILGELVWGVKRGYGTFLTMEFGTPHLVVREPVKSITGTPKVVRNLEHRRVSIFGELSLFIRDSRWSILNKDRTVDLNSSETIVQEILQDLDGQRVTAVSCVSGADTTLEFDLGITVRLGKSLFPTEARSVLWTLGRFGSSSISLLNDGTTLRGDEAES